MRGPDLSGEIIDRRYKIVERLSEGAMGVVYRGTRLKLDRAVAVKVMHASLPDAMDARKRFEREAKMMARLEHPHCVSIIDYGIYSDKPYVVMELVRGRSLLEILDEHGRFEIPRATDVVCQVLSGLAHAHDQGIIHRDIKPANIMITPKAPLGVHARILDFGLARMLGASASLSRGFAVGTPSYMAPEQCRGEKVDARADIYSCGVVLFEMLTGKKPFIAKDPIAIVKKHIQEVPPLLSAVKPDDYGKLEGIVARALAKAPDDRYPTAIAMAEALDSAVTGRSSTPEVTAEMPVLGSSGEQTAVLQEPSVDVPITVGSSVHVPAERPVERAHPQVRYVVIGVLCLAAAAVIGMIASRIGSSDEPADPVKRPVAHAPPADAAAEPLDQLLADATKLAGAGKLDAAIDMLNKAKRRYPDRAALPLLLGKLYFSKLWWNDGLANLREAVRIDPDLKTDTALLKLVLHGFLTTPSYDERLARFVVELGPAMKPLLEETVRDHPKPEIRSRCQTVLRRMN